MNILITGGVKNGKSHLAQSLCCSLSLHGRRFYVATMLPTDSEDLKRIERHVYDRKDLGFETVECAINIQNAVIPDMQDIQNCVLVDSLTALLANEMFLNGTYIEDASDKVSKDLVSFMHSVKNAVFVSDGIYSDSIQYDDITDSYRAGLALCEKVLAAECDCVIEMFCGLPIVHKGNIDMHNMTDDKLLIKKDVNLIIGGAYQGKTLYAKQKFSLNEDEIFVCRKDVPCDFSKKCITHIENYVWYCLKNNLPLTHDFSEGTIIIADDVFCGIVPMDSFERKWRESCGTYLQALAKISHVTRIICGIAQVVQ
ncbi:MAG: bifunctional adenosylcobinamide kinase/adenosylcobinamide-phosphate guanylyltransferase [Treponema sp.]|nr:bifunctional adenosylcobinamide kinase/adenosylcobinamide-phosphate guanylyltransferase [Treponema sp.]